MNSKAFVLSYMKDQFGDNHGYSFDSNNRLAYSKDKSHKNYNEHQKKINKGVLKIMKSKKTVNVEISANKSKFSIPIKRGKDLDADGRIVMGKN